MLMSLQGLPWQKERAAHQQDASASDRPAQTDNAGQHPSDDHEDRLDRHGRRSPRSDRAGHVVVVGDPRPVRSEDRVEDTGKEQQQELCGENDDEPDDARWADADPDRPKGSCSAELEQRRSSRQCPFDSSCQRGAHDATKSWDAQDGGVLPGFEIEVAEREDRQQR